MMYRMYSVSNGTDESCIFMPVQEMSSKWKRCQTITNNEVLLTGFKFKIQYLASAELSQQQQFGTEKEIAEIIRNVHLSYSKANKSIKKARRVVLFVDAQRINVFDKLEGEVFLNFPLTQVRDVTSCLDKPPYSKACVFVAKEAKERHYKAYVFHCKTSQEAVKLYKAVSLAFNVGFQLLKRSCRSDDMIAEASTMIQHSDDAKDGGPTTDSVEITTRERRSCTSCNPEQDVQQSRRPEAMRHEDIKISGRDDKKRTVTVQLEPKPQWQKMKEEETRLHVDTEADFDSPNFEESTRESSRFSHVLYNERNERISWLSPIKWFRSSRQMFRVVSGRDTLTASEDTPL